MRLTATFISFALVLVLWGFTGNRSVPIRFKDAAGRSGIRFVLNNGSVPDKPIIDTTLGGVALLDFDNDGYLDIFFANGASIPGLKKENPAFWNRLYRNNHDGTFTDVTAKAGVAGEGYSMGAATGDFNNDGWVDLFVAGVNRNILYRNNADGTFTDVTRLAGLEGTDAGGKKPWSVSAAWLDYNRDGNLDLFVTNYLDWSFGNNVVCGDPGKRLSCAPVFYKGLANLLYRNNGDGTFTDVSEAAGIAAHIGKGMGVAVADFNRDGYPDIFVANDNERNFLFKNIGGQRFEEIGISAAVAFTEDGVPVSGMGVDFRDWNNDGLPDVVETALEGETFPLFLNLGNEFFSESSYQSGIGYASLRKSGWGAGLFDFDNDGFKDLFTANSHVSENAPLYGQHQYKQANSVFRNQGNGKFRDLTKEAGLGGAVGAHRGCAFGDLNNDGRIDVVVSAIGGAPRILYNDSPGGNHWILIQARGRTSNRDAIGAAMKLTAASGLTEYNHVTTSVGYASSSDKRVHFGLGRDTRVRELEITWPSGKVQKLRNIAADQVLKVDEP